MEKKLRSIFSLEAIVLAAILLLLLPLRTIQYYTVIEGGNGFFKRVDSNVIVFVTVFSVAVFFFLVSAFIKRKQISLETAPKCLPTCGALALLASGGAIWEVYFQYKNIGFDATEYVVSSTTSTGVVLPITYVKLGFGVLTAIYFLALSLCFLSGKSAGDKLRLLSLAPVIKCTISLVLFFMSTISYLRVSDLTLDMLSLVFFAMFYMAFAQANGNVNSKGSEWRLAGFGLCACLISSVCFVPRAVLFVAGHSDLTFILSYANLGEFSAGLFALATVITRIVPKKSNIITQETAE